MEQTRIADETATNDVFGATKQTGHITSAYNYYLYYFYISRLSVASVHLKLGVMDRYH